MARTAVRRRIGDLLGQVERWMSCIFGALRPIEQHALPTISRNKKFAIERPTMKSIRGVVGFMKAVESGSFAAAAR